MNSEFIMRYARKVLFKLKIMRNHYRVKNRDVTIISQNCLGGVIYHDCGLSFKSPTINMFIEDMNFVKMVENLEHYLTVPAKPLVERYVDPIDSTVVYPKIQLDDIELCCLHYKNCAEAIEAWERRKKRINLKNIRVIANSWNLHENRELIKRVVNTPYKTVCLTYNDYDMKNCIKLKGDFWRLDIRGILRPNVTDFIPGKLARYYEKQFDFIKFINDDMD